MLDPIIISYKLTINLSVTYYRIPTIPVNTTYNMIFTTLSCMEYLIFQAEIIPLIFG